jgi:Arc/MetJ-type ribon-helix-helix transcriptional regulator
MDSPDNNISSKQVGVRLPGHLYRWLKEKVDGGEYPNMAQSVIGELTKARTLEEVRRRETSGYAAREDEPIMQMVNERIEGFRREILDEVKRQRRT